MSKKFYKFNIIHITEQYIIHIDMRLGAPTNLEKMKQDLGRKCSAWNYFGLGLEISLHSSLRDRVKWDLRLGVNC